VIGRVEHGERSEQKWEGDKDIQFVHFASHLYLVNAEVEQRFFANK
jgi:hypothetical protein